MRKIERVFTVTCDSCGASLSSVIKETTDIEAVVEGFMRLSVPFKYFYCPSAADVCNSCADKVSKALAPILKDSTT